MSKIPEQYRWLLNEPGPRMIVEALALYGTLETPGSANNPTIIKWAQECDISGYHHDHVPWCGLFMAVVAQRAGKQFPSKPLWALNWKNFGTPVGQAMLGDVLVFSRQGGGHVALYVGEDHSHYHILGGNQKDEVNIVRTPKSRKPAIRRPIYRNQPANVRKIMLEAKGTVSGSEQ